MFIIYEYAACLIAAVIGAALVFTVGGILIVLKELSSQGARRLREITPRAAWLVGRWALEPRQP